MDWPAEKSELSKAIDGAIQERSVRNAPVATLALHFIAREGDGIVLVDPNGERRDIEIKAHEVEISVPRAEMLRDPASHLARLLEELSKGMGQQMDMSLLEKIRTAPGIVGGFFRGDDKVELEAQILNTLRGMDLSFDDEGKPEIVFLAHPELAAKLAALDEEGDPAAKSEFDMIVEEKRREWLRRESSRRLVD